MESVLSTFFNGTSNNLWRLCPDDTCHVQIQLTGETEGAEELPVVAGARDEPVLVCQAGVWTSGGKHVGLASGQVCNRFQ